MINEIINDDCRNIFPKIESDSIDLILTDPPYLITPRGSNGTMGGMLTKKINKQGKVFKENNIKISEYLHEFYRILKDGTHCYIMCNHTNLIDFMYEIRLSKFHFVKSLIWDKCNKIAGQYYMNSFEYILMLRKGKGRPVNDCSVPDIIRCPNIKTKINNENIHDSQKPCSLFELLINQSTKSGDIVLDPFIGSGTTALACLITNRKFIGIEKDVEYFNLSQNLIKEFQLDLF